MLKPAVAARTHLPLREPGDRELWRSCSRGARTEFGPSLGNRSASGQYEWQKLATARTGELA